MTELQDKAGTMPAAFDAEEAEQERRILVVEDDPAMLIALRDILEGDGFRVTTATNGRLALEQLEEFEPSLILSDISMPVMDGIELFENFRKLPMGTSTPFVFLTARGESEDIAKGKEIGVDDFLVKPVTSKVLLATVRGKIDRVIQIRLDQLKVAYKASLRIFANAIEARDYYTRDHVERVSAYSAAMARQLDWPEARLDALEFGAILHDVGKIAVRESILVKTGPLRQDEWDEMREHPVVGARMIENISYLAAAIPIVLYHHERWDGSGYPEGLSGTNIPLEARLLAVADTYDAMTSDRPYRKALPESFAFETILSEADKLFDPVMVEAFAAVWQSGQLTRLREAASAYAFD